MTDTAYEEFFLGSRSDVVQLELLSFQHPAFSKRYDVVRNSTDGVTVTLENGDERTFEYYPLRITPVGTRGDLDYGLRIQLGDLGEIIPHESEAVRESAGYATKPTATYRVYRSDDLTRVLFGPLTLEMTEVVVSRDGASFSAQAPILSILATGDLYTVSRFPMLRGTL